VRATHPHGWFLRDSNDPVRNGDFAVNAQKPGDPIAL
jgi:hypothetical protein